jgi:oligopeptidase B
MTNEKGAKNFKLMETPVGKTGQEHWKEVIAHRDDILIEDFDVFADFVAVQEKQNGLTRIEILDRESEDRHLIDFGEPTYAADLGDNHEYQTKILRYDYESLTTPDSVYDYEVEERERTLIKEDPVLGGFNRDEYEAERVFATAADGTKVPVSIVYRKGMERNGKNPLLQYGYGSYGYSIDATFNSDRLSLLDRGFIFAIAHIRGGSEMGRYWYEDGKLLKKKNTFTDFTAVSEYLIEQGYTSPEHLYATGGSAGGLLMGAVVNMRPDLYHGIYTRVPFVDVITTMLDEDIPLTTGEYDEWGNPNDKEYYDYMLSYSPYDNVEAKDYPNMLVTTGLHDSQVQYWEPAKWVAKLRVHKTDDNRLLFRTNMSAGHSGASGRFQSIKETALNYAFVFDLEGIRE